MSEKEKLEIMKNLNEINHKFVAIAYWIIAICSFIILLKCCNL